MHRAPAPSCDLPLHDAQRIAARRSPALDVPFASAVHPDVAQIQEASVAWARAHGLVGEGRGLQRLREARIAWLPARAHPRGARRPLQIAADWTTLFCLLDDRIERLAGPDEVVAVLAGLEGCFDPSATSPGEHAMPELLRACIDLRRRIAAEGADTLPRFHARVRELFAAFVVESAGRSAGRVPELAAYLPLREQTVGLHVEFALGELVDGLALAASTRAHPHRAALARMASNLVGWANDIFTHEKEIEEGETNNLVFVLARAEGLDMAAALARAVELHDAELRAFVSLAAAADAPLRGYAAMLCAWVRGHLDWGRETGRYAPGREIT